MSTNDVNQKDLQEGGKLFELFWLRPKSYAGKSVPIRLRINKKWGGWKVKDELIRSLNLEVGDTISTEITPLLTSGIIDDDNDTDLFASGNGADWLLENNVGIGTVIDCYVKFVYSNAPVGLNGKSVYKISLVFEKGISVVGVDEDYTTSRDSSPHINNLLRSILE